MEVSMRIIGTSYFKDLYSAFRYYAPYGFDDIDVVRKISEGEIHIGKPSVEQGETLTLIDNGTRYAITSKGE
jgi:predicted membrane protein